MISRSFVCLLFILSKVSSFVVLPNAGTLQLGKQLKQNDDDSNAKVVVMKMAKDRRTFLVDTTTAAACSMALLVPQFSAVAAENSKLLLDTYQDEDCGFKVSVPSDWVKSVQSLRDRRKIVFFTDPSTSSSDQEKNLIFIAYTPVRDDFTSLTSFGSVEQVRTYSTKNVEVCLVLFFFTNKGMICSNTSILVHLIFYVHVRLQKLPYCRRVNLLGWKVRIP